MEPPNENQFSHFYQHHHHQLSAASAAQPTNGSLPNTHHQPSSDGTHMVYSHSVPSAVSTQLEPAKRKRGRPRKYGTPEQALAAKKATSSASKERADHQQGSALAGGASASSSSYSRKSQLDASGHAGQGFTPHVINVVAGEDVSQKVQVFVQRSRRAICILSASGSISNPSLRQPATSGGNITYEGQFEIISLSGSYIHNEVGGRSGGLSVCLCSTDGQVIGGVVAGPLNAAGPVQIIVGTFLMDTKRDVVAGAAQTGDVSAGKTVGGSMMGLGFPSLDSSSGRNPISSSNSNRGNDNNQNVAGASHFMSHSRALDMTPADWRTGPPGYDLTGRMGQQSPENGDYDNITE